VLKVSRSARYYRVHGTTPSTIFDDLERQGLSDLQGRRAIGLTGGEWNLEWKGIDTRAARCSSESVTITLKLAVTLPQHAQLEELAPDIRTAWRQFADRVAAHEQRHVDIYLNGARTMKARMEAIPTTLPSCSELERAINDIWVRQQAETDREQEAFHLEDEARIQNDRKPLQAQIEVNQTRLAAVDSQIAGLDRTLDGLRQRSDSSYAEIEAVRAEIGRSGGCSQPRLTSQTRTLCQRHNALVAAYNALVAEYNEAASRRQDLRTEHHRLFSVVSGLVETLNWTR